ncbi:MAG TPA: DUF4037 domain-containing protein [Longimicrobium sp.]|jgi:hypothetical protein
MPLDPLPPFVPGLRLSERFFHAAVRPLLAERFPGLAYAAGRLDRGSDVLGFDTAQSRDHHWGARLTLFLGEDDYRAHADAILALMGEELPFTVDGYPTHFDRPGFDGGLIAFTDRRPIAHGVTVTTPARFTAEYLGVDATREVGELDWLAIPSQRLGTVRAGRLFHDRIGLEAVRERLRWYPRDVWLYRMACQWVRVAQEEAFAARAGDAGDELGSRLVAARQVIELMRLCFLAEREYAPYWKWFGSAFARLACAPRLTPVFHAVLDAGGWKAREAALGPAYLHAGEMHNALGVTAPLEARMAPFHGRPYLVPHADRFAEALRGAIRSERLRALPAYGAVDQFADSTDVAEDVGGMRALTAIYRT